MWLWLIRYLYSSVILHWNLFFFSQVARKNGRILKLQAAPEAPSCNCQRSRKPHCPVPGKCTAKDVCYRCEVVRGDNHSCDNYVGQTCRPIKKRIGEHLTGARNFDPAKPLGSRLSQHIGNLFFNQIPHTLNWSILSQNRHFSPVTNFCMLCNVEKTFIIYHPKFPVSILEMSFIKTIPF